MNYVYRELHR